MNQDQSSLQKQVIKLGFTAGQDEVDRVRTATEVERDWWGEVPAHTDYQTILQAAATGELVKVDASPNYLPAMRFRNPKLHSQYPPYLELKTKQLLDELTGVWREAMDRERQNPDIRLAIANMTITEEYQQELVRSGKLAIVGNPHVRGVAFDIDASAYYLGETPVNDRKPVKEEYHKRFIDAGADSFVPPYRNFDDALTRRPLELFGVVLEQYMTAGKLNFILEYPGTNNAGFHICRSPLYRA